MIREAIAKITSGKDLCREEAAGVMEEIMTGGATDALIAAFLVALRLKGETPDEITGCATVMREKATKVVTRHSVVVDTCGTGGDHSGTFNISTTAAFVVAGAGLCVAKHGNRAASSRCGSADLLKALGVQIDLPPEQVGHCLDEVRIGFLFAPALHGAMKYAIGPRREIGIRTIFNILGPLTNPAGATRQVIGVYDKTLTETMAEVLRQLGSERVFVVHGDDGLDEITTTTTTTITELHDGEIRTYTVTPEDLGLSRADRQVLLGGDETVNTGITMDVLNGKHGPQRDIVLANAAAGIVAGGAAATLREGIVVAAESINSGRALGKLELLKQVSNSGG
ncbi:MAG: anthranilate phosphoribosyltransferase [Candidatus Latescibacteria bacterium]|nr:anthranilate phosphoribosyltransferase [Candidatus Latescibacterota bacterium]